ncbi:MAG: hypothetical protein ABSA21_00995 [Candidatus Limnocylindrales bacterium]|jgi:hypothetical protein
MRASLTHPLAALAAELIAGVACARRTGDPRRLTGDPDLARLALRIAVESDPHLLKQ